MSDYSIGLSGLAAAQAAFDVIGNNLANATSDGYHRQRINLNPSNSTESRNGLNGGGVTVAGVTRLVDALLDKTIYAQISTQGQVDRELASLQTIENALGELATEDGGLNASLDRFFEALNELSAYPDQDIYLNSVVSEAESLTGQFRLLGDFLANLDTQIQLEAQNAVDSVNSLLHQIADLNTSIQKVEVTGTETANNLRDQRDHVIMQLSELVGVEVQDRDFGVTDITISGIPVVLSGIVMDLEIGLDKGGNLGIGVVGGLTYESDIQGGSLGGLLSLKNDTVSNLKDNLDSLAVSLIRAVNNCHAQGIGSAGSFTELSGLALASEDLSDIDPPITNGKLYVRVTDASGQSTRHAIDVAVATDSLTSLATKISGVTGLNASVVDGALYIAADGGYTFDFLPEILSGPNPASLNLTGSSPPTISLSGQYTGNSNETLKFAMSGTGTVGNGSLILEVKRGTTLVATLNVGSGYAAGDPLEVADGIWVTLGTGDLNNGDSFEVDVFADTDTSGVLAALGMNCFFSGSGASDMNVCPAILANSRRVAVAQGRAGDDNANIKNMLDVQDLRIKGLEGLTCGEFYRRMVTEVGQEISLKKVEQDTADALLKNYLDQQGAVSGVDVNEESASLLVYEQMYQSMAQYISTVQSNIMNLMELL